MPNGNTQEQRDNKNMLDKIKSLIFGSNRGIIMVITTCIELKINLNYYKILHYSLIFRKKL